MSDAQLAGPTPAPVPGDYYYGLERRQDPQQGGDNNNNGGNNNAGNNGGNNNNNGNQNGGNNNAGNNDNTNQNGGNNNQNGGNNNGGDANNGNNNNGGNNNQNGGNNNQNQNGGNNNGNQASSNGGNNGGNNNNRPTTTGSSTSLKIPQSAPAGSIVMIQPASSASQSYYKIASGEDITFKWNFTNVLATPESITVVAYCADNNVEYKVGPTDGSSNTLPGKATQVVWNPYEWQLQPGQTPFQQATYTLKIFDERGTGVALKAGYLTPYTGTKFGMYKPQAYTPFAGECERARCSRTSFSSRSQKTAPLCLDGASAAATGGSCITRTKLTCRLEVLNVQRRHRAALGAGRPQHLCLALRHAHFGLGYPAPLTTFTLHHRLRHIPPHVSPRDRTLHYILRPVDAVYVHRLSLLRSPRSAASGSRELAGEPV